MLIPTLADIDSDVPYIACADSATGKQLAALVPPGSGQLSVTSPSTTGIAPSRYMQPSTCGVPGRQSVPLNRALLTAPLVPVIRSAARLSSRRISPVSISPEPLISVNGVASANMNVERSAGAPTKPITRFGPPAPSPSSGSKFAASPLIPHSSPAAQSLLPPDTTVRR